MKLHRLINYLAVLAVVAASVFAPVSQAEEGGAGHYIPGGVASLIDLPPTKGGWVLETMYLHYDGDASAAKTLPVAGVLAGGLSATSDAVTVGSLYTFDQKFLGAHYSLGAFLPYVWMDVSANVTLTGRSRIRTDKADGIGDLLIIPAMMAWEINDWQINAMLPVYAPTGDYQVGRLANPGLNHWTFDPTVGGSYNNAKTGFNAALHTGFAFSTKNKDTNYRNGTIFHADTTVQQLLPLGKGFLGIGAEAFYYQQITGDSGSGARLGDNKASTVGLGPVLSYILPVGDNSLVAEVRWLTELETERRVKGDYIWFKIVYQF
ncbi:MAG: transporter [Verrucomicrobiota bacterium]